MRAIIAMAALLCAPQLAYGQRTAGGGGEELRAGIARTFDRADAFYGRAFESLREAAPVDTVPVGGLLQEVAVLRAAPGLERADGALLGRLAANLEKLRRVAPYLGSAGREAAGIPPGASAARAADASGWPRVSAIVIQNVLDELRAPLSNSQVTAEGALAVATRAERLSMLGVLLPLYDEFLAVRSDLAARGGGAVVPDSGAAGAMSLGVTVSAHARSVVGVGAFAEAAGAGCWAEDGCSWAWTETRRAARSREVGRWATSSSSWGRSTWPWRPTYGSSRNGWIRCRGSTSKASRGS